MVSQTKSRKIPTRKILPLFFVGAPEPVARPVRVHNPHIAGPAGHRDQAPSRVAVHGAAAAAGGWGRTRAGSRRSVGINGVSTARRRHRGLRVPALVLDLGAEAKVAHAALPARQRRAVHQDLVDGRLHTGGVRQGNSNPCQSASQPGSCMMVVPTYTTRARTHTPWSRNCARQSRQTTVGGRACPWRARHPKRSRSSIVQSLSWHTRTLAHTHTRTHTHTHYLVTHAPG